MSGFYNRNSEDIKAFDLPTMMQLAGNVVASSLVYYNLCHRWWKDGTWTLDIS